MNRILRWEEEGYRVFDWNDYKASINSLILAHDLFHHHPNDKGTDEEELIGLGGYVRFHRPSVKILRYNIEKYGEKIDNKKKIFGSDVYLRNSKGYNIKLIKEACMGLDSQEYYARQVIKGYKHSKQFTEQLYFNFIEKNNFKELHNSSSDLILATSGKLELLKDT